jgi:4-hydroxybenzoate polyprenyltransferase
MNYGFVNAYAFMAGQLDLAVVPFMAGLWCWTVLYDTIYALQDLKCDKKIGNNSTAVAWEGSEMKVFDRLTVGMGVSFALAGYLAELGTIFYPALGFALWKFSRTWIGLDLKDMNACSESFKKNHRIGG